MNPLFFALLASAAMAGDAPPLPEPRREGGRLINRCPSECKVCLGTAPLELRRVEDTVEVWADDDGSLRRIATIRGDIDDTARVHHTALQAIRPRCAALADGLCDGGGRESKDIIPPEYRARLSDWIGDYTERPKPPCLTPSGWQTSAQYRAETAAHTARKEREAAEKKAARKRRKAAQRRNR